MKTQSSWPARIVGVLFIIGTVAGALSGVFVGPTFGAPNFPANVAGDANQLVIGALLVLLMGVALAMVPVVLFPVLRQHDETLAFGYVIFRGALEPLGYIGTALGWFLLIALSRAAGSLDDQTLQFWGAVINDAENWIGQIEGVVFGLGSLMLNVVFYRSRLIPRWLSGWGVVGALLYVAGNVAGMFDPLHPTLSLEAGLGMLMAPTALQEMVKALWLIVKGFNQPAPSRTQAAGHMGLPAHSGGTATS